MRHRTLRACFLAFASLLTAATLCAAAARPSAVQRAAAKTSATSRMCLACHEKQALPVVAQQWLSSRHAWAGVGCYECHRADQDRPDAFDHYGFRISLLVTPKRCGTCHAKETEEFEASHHAQAGQILGSLDNVLGEDVEGPAAVVSGCAQCHGSVIKVLANGKLDPATWPNEGIGRINPDGSKGSCSVCHSRHTFSLAIARQPEGCGYCHLGPDHPQEEIYVESKHGVTYRASIAQMHLHAKSWVLGKDYNAAPTCATCHMGATPDLPETHDVGTRLSWNLRPEIAVHTADWRRKGAEMRAVCLNCHGPDWVENFYAQYDSVVVLGNEKFFRPAQQIMQRLQAAGKISPTPFAAPIQWTYFELWHHEGRRARMGASMNGPDYVQWHGFYDIARVFYGEFVPQAEQLLPGVTKDVLDMPAHQWLKGLSPEQRKKIREYYEKREQPSR